MTTTAPLTVELLGYPDCPNIPALRANLKAALAKLQRDCEFTDTNLDTLPDDDARRGYPSPTILVNGRDVSGPEAGGSAVAACRLFEGGVPGPDDLAAQIIHRLSN